MTSMLITSVLIWILQLKGLIICLTFGQFLVYPFSALKSHDESDYNHFMVQLGHMISNLDGPTGQVKPDKLLMMTFGDGESYDYIAETKNPLVDSVKGLHYP